MEIKDAIRQTRFAAEDYETKAIIQHSRNTHMLAEISEYTAEAMRTVCDELEAFLRKQKEDNSYHTQGGRPYAD